MLAGNHSTLNPCSKRSTAQSVPAPANAEGQLLRQVAVTSPCMRVQVRKKLNWFLPYLDPRTETHMH